VLGHAEEEIVENDFVEMAGCEFDSPFHVFAVARIGTGSGLALGTVLMAAAILRAVLMLAAGATTDRYSPRNVMLVAERQKRKFHGFRCNSFQSSPPVSCATRKWAR
jgi:hypothetical protein